MATATEGQGRLAQSQSTPMLTQFDTERPLFARPQKVYARFMGPLEGIDRTLAAPRELDTRTPLAIDRGIIRENREAHMEGGEQMSHQLDNKPSIPNPAGPSPGMLGLVAIWTNLATAIYEAVRAQRETGWAFLRLPGCGGGAVSQGNRLRVQLPGAVPTRGDRQRVDREGQ